MHTETRLGMMVLRAYMRGAAISTSISKGFLRAYSRNVVAYSSTLRVFNKSLLGNWEGDRRLYNGNECSGYDLLHCESR